MVNHHNNKFLFPGPKMISSKTRNFHWFEILFESSIIDKFINWIYWNGYIGVNGILICTFIPFGFWCSNGKNWKWNNNNETEKNVSICFIVHQWIKLNTMKKIYKYMKEQYYEQPNTFYFFAMYVCVEEFKKANKKGEARINKIVWLYQVTANYKMSKV